MSGNGAMVLPLLASLSLLASGAPIQAQALSHFSVAQSSIWLVRGAAPPWALPPATAGRIAAEAKPAGASAGQARTDVQEFRVRLLTPISTQVNRKGDKITAQVLDPAGYNGAIMEGEIRGAKSSGKLKGKSTLNFTFERLHHAGQVIPVRCSIKSVVNSQGAPDVDEEGRLIRKKNSVGKTVAAAGLGALIGAAVSGAKGAAIGAGIGAAAALVFIEVATEGANVSFASGSEFVLINDTQ